MANYYEQVNTQDYRGGVKDEDYSLKNLDNDWHGVFAPHLHGV